MLKTSFIRWCVIEALHWFYQQADDFLQKLKQDLSDFQSQIEPHWEIDHICYRVESLSRYEILKSQFLNFGNMLIESKVNGRPIATFKLNQPLKFGEQIFDVVELPAPKPGKTVVEGFEHVEIVCDTTFEDISRRFRHCKIDTSGLKKNFNQEFEIHLNQCNFKFHQLSLESVIRLEKNEKVHNVIRKSKVLEVLKVHNPLIAGTFPLGLENETSDVDILLQAEDLDQLLLTATENWGHLDGFRTFTEEVDGLDTLIMQFLVDYVPFELFAQNRPAVYQNAYRHFLIEERIIKYGSKALFEKIYDLRRQGVKTEQAFAEALNMEGDPYHELLKFEKLSPEQLRNKLNL